MFKIGEFANFIKVPIKTLRYYDEIGIFKPIRVEDETSYRYYSASQLPLLNRILYLKDIGFSLKQISYVLENNLSNKELIDMLNLKDMELNETIRLEQDRKRKVNSLIKFLNEEDSNMKYDVVIKEVSPFTGACLRGIVKSYDAMGELWGELVSHIEKNNSSILPGCTTIYYDPGYKENNVDCEVIELVSKPVPSTDRIKYREVEGGTMATIIHKGTYENFNQTYNGLLKWIEENGYITCGPNREIYWEGEWTGKAPEDFITEIQIPVKRA